MTEPRVDNADAAGATEVSATVPQPCSALLEWVGQLPAESIEDEDPALLALLGGC